MGKATDIRVLEVSATTEQFDYRVPIKFGGRVLNDVTLLHVTARVETRDGRTGEGFGSMPMGNVWGWPSAVLSTDQTLAGMIEAGRRIARAANDYEGIGHPLEITHDLASLYSPIAEGVVRDLRLAQPMPRLAQLVAASPVEAAIYDAYGKALGQNAYNLMGEAYVARDLGEYLDADFAGEYLDRYTLRDPKPRMPLYHLIGALDALDDGDITRRVNDGLPETLPEWIAADGLTHMKIKLNGDDLAWDVNRVISVERVAARAQEARGCGQWVYSADFNEKCQNVEYVLDFLAKIREQSPAAFDRLQYIEQPTHRDLRANPENRMHAAAKIKPVVIDESLVDFESLLLSRELGYSGVALKACKGHSEALLMGAAAQKYGMFLCVQDLTCVGASFLHSASLSARIPTVAAIEGNGRQYCPVANAGWADRFPSMFDITDGTLGTAALGGPGLGF